MSARYTPAREEQNGTNGRQSAQLGAQSPEISPNTALRSFSGPIERDDKAAVGIIKIILVTVNRRGRSSASLSDGTVFVASSRQPFLDADAVDDQVERPNVHRRKARSDGLFAVGWADDADGPFESCGFAEAGTAEKSPDEIFPRAE